MNCDEWGTAGIMVILEMGVQIGEVVQNTEQTEEICQVEKMSEKVR
jgi:hypothetical protein